MCRFFSRHNPKFIFGYYLSKLFILSFSCALPSLLFLPLVLQSLHFLLSLFSWGSSPLPLLSYYPSTASFLLSQPCPFTCTFLIQIRQLMKMFSMFTWTFQGPHWCEFCYGFTMFVYSTEFIYTKNINQSKYSVTFCVQIVNCLISNYSIYLMTPIPYRMYYIFEQLNN